MTLPETANIESERDVEKAEETRDCLFAKGAWEKLVLDH